MSIKCNLTGDYIGAGSGDCPNDAVHIMSGANVFGRVPICDAHRQVLDYPRAVVDRMIVGDCIMDTDWHAASPRFRPIPPHVCGPDYDDNRRCYTCGARDRTPLRDWLKSRRPPNNTTEVAN